jgi:hypothetical protein
MSKRIYKVGENVEKMCSTCNEELEHIVRAVTKAGGISRVICSKCGVSSTSKTSAAATKATKATKIQNLANKTGEPYSTAKTYRAGQILSHPTFGTGEVMTVFDTKTIDVLFMDRVRRLIHSRFKAD